MVAPFPSTRFASSGPASGPSTPMCFWPAALVAAIFHPTTGCPDKLTISRCAA